jgi:hypothetical protein
VSCVERKAGPVYEVLPNLDFFSDYQQLAINDPKPYVSEVLSFNSGPKNTDFKVTLNTA